jgi:bifunctional polynucleotide phosphatase/kinase
MTGMWTELEKLYAEDGVRIGEHPSPLILLLIISRTDKASSFFVGDAAGRHYKNSTKMIDFAATDRKWALNLDLKFYTPEVTWSSIIHVSSAHCDP